MLKPAGSASVTPLNDELQGRVEFSTSKPRLLTARISFIIKFILNAADDEIT